MTTTYDPFHPAYYDERDLRQELDRVYDLCHGCRLCFKFCPSFPTLFDYVDAIPNQEAAKMTPAQQDHVVDECFNCKLCYVNCPYTPDQHEWNLDFPRLMLRAEQVLHRTRKRSLKTRVTDRALASTDLLGKVNSAGAPLVNKALGPTGTAVRGLVERTVGIARERVLAPYAKQRFSTWFKRRSTQLGRAKQAKVAVFATCLVEYQDVGVGHDLVKVYERNGVECTLPDGQICCGAPALHQGDVDRFAEQARQNIAALSEAIREADAAGEHLDVVVPQPTCGYVLKFDYRDYVGGPDADLVAERTHDAAEYLVSLHKADDTELDTEFPGDVPATITYHAPCHLRAQNVGLKSRDLMKLTGSKIKVVAECSGIDGTWGMRAENVDAARKVAKKMVDAIEKADSDVITGDCSLANGGIVLETGKVPLHPLSMMARAYGIAPEPDVPTMEADNG
ncbi:MAG: heterodisulfide reductase-related iron-sulfur binding cluster [Acidimicrobiia bacterium]|nr:heterodisulfide reductase-related iron-sulfur binding cluster [Acidimicrobiia bacterium]MDH5238980.1 heterodisulfide reductase-related iron-sulfur binding cluster [Acidimicrobiia bacterium]